MEQQPFDSTDRPLNSRPLVVDLDGTLIQTDLLFESVSVFFTSHPLQFLKLFKWGKQGKSILKKNLALACHLDPAHLPYNKTLTAWLEQQKREGRQIILATASHQHYAEAIAIHLNFFDEVLATHDDINLKAETKRDTLIARFGPGGFDYVGNHADDIPVWQYAKEAYLVSNSSSFIEKINRLGNLTKVFPNDKPTTVQALMKALRLYQWVKNLLIFLPLIAAHMFGSLHSDLLASLAFIAFGLTASSVYLLNDLIDVSDDRHHHRKRQRPFAAGHLSLKLGWILWPILFFSAFTISAFCLPYRFLAVLSTYFCLSFFYSIKLKRMAILDVLALATLYTLRIIAGALAIGVLPSFWLLSFSMFIFLSLAFLKRFNELKAARLEGFQDYLHGRGYTHQDLEIVSQMGICAGYLSVLVLALYIQDAHTAKLYLTPNFIWLACPILLYWISRTHLIAHRGNMHDDPIIFAINDRVSWAVALCFIGVFVLAKFA